MHNHLNTVICNTRYDLPTFCIGKLLHTSGVKNTTLYCKLAQVYFPFMTTMADSVCTTCYHCQLSVGKPRPQKAVYKWTHTGYPWTTLSIDIGTFI